MLVLIDYDNVEERERRQGVDHVVRKSLELIGPVPSDSERVTVRLYGGWCEAGRLTRLAQSIKAQIDEKYPVALGRGDSVRELVVNVQLALSGIFAPRILISNSYREKGAPRGIKCETRPWLECRSNDGCALGRLDRFLADDVCGDNGCAVRPREVLRKSEQKVVDTLMVADLISFASTQGGNAAVVSRDDDIWPGLYVASSSLRSLVHLSSVIADRFPRYFREIPSPPYRFVCWS